MTELEREKYVSFTTFRRDGTPVSTPVWIAPMGGGRLAFTTDPGSWKVKRLRHNDRVELRPCTMRGEVRADAPVVTGRATLVDEPGPYGAVVAALKAKYGLQVTLIELGGRLKHLLRRGSGTGELAIVIHLDQPG